MKVIFWLSAAVIFYTYFLFTLMLVVRSVIRKHPVERGEKECPNVSVVIAAYNEEKSIEAKLVNILSLDYPEDKLEVVIASDGSTDGTNRIVSNFDDPRIRFLALPRRGKAKTLNSAVDESSGDILVFSDANSMYRSDALKELVSYFADPEVGGVAGNQVYRKESVTSGFGQGEQSYWSFDRFLKELQSRAGNTISATGAIYAIRRSLFQPVPDGVTDDFVTSTRVILQGYRLVFAANAIAYEPVSASNNVEFNRKVRIMTRGFHGVMEVRDLLKPNLYGFYSLQLFSHKILRRLAIFPLIALLISNLFIWQYHWFYAVTMIGQIVFYFLAFVGYIFEINDWKRIKIFSIPFYFCAVNAAALVALIKLILGQQINMWTPQREEGNQAN